MTTSAPPRFDDAPLSAVADFHRASSRHSWDRADTPFRPTAPSTQALPPAALPDNALSACIAGRLSCRRFDQAAALPAAALSSLLHLSYGHLGMVETLQQTLETRPVPSASGFYPLAFLVFARAVENLPAAIYRYDPSAQSLSAIAALPDAPTMMQVFLQQPWAAQAPAIVVMTGQPQAVVGRYHARGYRFLLLECGHVGQNLLLGAAALGLAGCPLGGFEDYRLCCAAGLDAEREWPLYAVALGSPDPAHLSDLRTPQVYAQP
ncbi:SagB/ThcOx family dehydrogenase [Roseobacter sinensis]|uniref:SagB/ThcOx family dehydrogenase n=1 Tax=Roseobacter sinensis TaxID=2931391 RepID=A0ABT3BGV3_9RHOB|nr:SagB/ThcOx family dehydrogenase [Roseobacter sp. WL0113]MCV3272811.1 SagB/ThcOx family dehydrogenase [Roseobacter sp. WL0113]